MNTAEWNITINVLPSRNLGSVEIQGPRPEQWAIHRLDGPRSFSLSPSKGTKRDQLIDQCKRWGLEWARERIHFHGGTPGAVSMEIV